MNGTALLVLLMESRTRVQRYFAVMRYQRSIGLCFVLALFAGACKKEDEPKAPSVVIVSPTSGTDVSVPDTLQVVVEVNGEDPVDQVTFTLTNADGIPVGASVSVVPATDPARIEVGIPLTSDARPALLPRNVDAFASGLGLSLDLELLGTPFLDVSA